MTIIAGRRVIGRRSEVGSCSSWPSGRGRCSHGNEGWLISVRTEQPLSLDVSEGEVAE